MQLNAREPLPAERDPREKTLPTKALKIPLGARPSCCHVVNQLPDEQLPQAVLIEAALEEAMDALPVLILDALIANR